MSIPSIEIIGSGVAGLCCAMEFAERGCEVTLKAASNGIDEGCCSWWAGGMLAPWCELESAEPLIAKLGLESIEFWRKHGSEFIENGSLVVANRRDNPDLEQFAGRTQHFEKVSRDTIATLEPDLAGRFDSGLYFSQECHLDPRQSLINLMDKLERHPSVHRVLGAALSMDEMLASNGYDWRIDCRGLAASDVLTDLRGVRGEMLLLSSPDVSLTRPVRLLHPRFPLYIVPRANNVYMVGATMIESNHRHSPSVRSVMELLSMAYSLQPAFAEATILEIGADVRPAFIDNMPRLRRRGKTLYVNGLFRHGFLCAPAMARRAAELALENCVDTEVVDENYS